MLNANERIWKHPLCLISEQRPIARVNLLQCEDGTESERKAVHFWHDCAVDGEDAHPQATRLSNTLQPLLTTSSSNKVESGAKIQYQEMNQYDFSHFIPGMRRLWRRPVGLMRKSAGQAKK